MHVRQRRQPHVMCATAGCQLSRPPGCASTKAAWATSPTCNSSGSDGEVIRIRVPGVPSGVWRGCCLPQRDSCLPTGATTACAGAEAAAKLPNAAYLDHKNILGAVRHAPQLRPPPPQQLLLHRLHRRLPLVHVPATVQGAVHKSNTGWVRGWFCDSYNVPFLPMLLLLLLLAGAPPVVLAAVVHCAWKASIACASELQAPRGLSPLKLLAAGISQLGSLAVHLAAAALCLLHKVSGIQPVLCEAGREGRQNSRGSSASKMHRLSAEAAGATARVLQISTREPGREQQESAGAAQPETLPHSPCVTPRLPAAAATRVCRHCASSRRCTSAATSAAMRSSAASAHNQPVTGQTQKQQRWD